MFKYAIWDYDGTLADTYPGILKSLKQTLHHFADDDLAISDQQLYRKIKLGSVTKELQNAAQGLQLDFLTMQKYYQNLDHQAQLKVKLYPQAQEILQIVIAAGGQNFLLTHRDDQVKDLLQQQGIAQLFTEVITSSLTFARKPNPQALNYLINKYQLPKEQTVMIGDRSLDVLAGHNAGIASIYFDVDGFHDRANAEYSVQQLIDIQSLFGR